VFENIQNPPFWNTHEGVFWTKTDREHTHFADWDGDGKCDILYVDQVSGQVAWWRNTYNGVGDVPTFATPAVVVQGPACLDRDGVGLYDQAARFPDLDGDGRADYICLDVNGGAKGWQSTPAGGKAFAGSNGNQIRLSIGLDRANLRYVDMDLDGRADLVWYAPMRPLT
jgi:hypothetical protein